jgi:hypothetical protein
MSLLEAAEAQLAGAAVGRMATQAAQVTWLEHLCIGARCRHVADLAAIVALHGNVIRIEITATGTLLAALATATDAVVRRFPRHHLVAQTRASARCRRDGRRGSGQIHAQLAAQPDDIHLLFIFRIRHRGSRSSRQGRRASSRSGCGTNRHRRGRGARSGTTLLFVQMSSVGRR